jgi:uncharacterized protein
MKSQIFRNLLCIALLLVASIVVKAQTEPTDADITKMQQVNGSAGSIDAMYPRIVAQLKAAKPGVTEEQWATVKKEVFDVEAAELSKQLIPIYKKHFTQDEVKAIIAFYESPIGKKLAEQTPLITTESMQISQVWAMGLFSKIQAYLDK